MISTGLLPICIRSAAFEVRGINPQHLPQTRGKDTFSRRKFLLPKLVQFDWLGLLGEGVYHR